MNQHEKINYVEFPATNLGRTKKFFESVFGWTFTDYGPDYTSFSDQGLNGGFVQSDVPVSQENGSALIVFYSETLEKTLGKIELAGGTIVKPVFSFPGGRRFQFVEPSGNELAVWSDRDEEGNPIK